MKQSLHIELISETYPPEVNGVALTVQALEQGLRGLGHRVALVRTERAEDSPRAQPDLMLVQGAPLPSYPGLRFGLPAGRRLQARWTAQRPDAIYIATVGCRGLLSIAGLAAFAVHAQRGRLARRARHALPQRCDRSQWHRCTVGFSFPVDGARGSIVWMSTRVCGAIAFTRSATVIARALPS